MIKEYKFANAIVKLIVLLLLFISGYLLIVSLFSTVYISEQENVYFIKDSFMKNLALLLVFISVVYFFREKINSIISSKENKMVLFNSILLSFILLAFIYSTRFYPLYDQAKIMNAVKRLFVYDYSDYIPGGYIERCDVQKGITLYFYFLTNLFGKIDITKFQILNGIFIVFSNYFIYRIFETLFSGKKAALIHLALCLFVPQWFYTSFIYGLIPSMFFGTLAVYLFIKTINSDTRTKNIVNSLLTGIILCISIVLKTNSVIILIALVLISLFYIITTRDRLKFILIIVSIVFFYMISGKVVNGYSESLTDIRMQGAPRTSHIAMGLMENPEKAPGWYNGYSAEVYNENDFDKEKANTASIESIKESLNRFKSNPASFVSFLSRKIVSQWNEPTCESLYILYGRDSLGKTKELIKKLTTPTSSLNKSVRELFNIVQFIILFGFFLYLVLRFNDISMKELIPLIVVLGGFFFLIISEAKSQYVLVYYLLIIPYSVIGTDEFVKRLKILKTEIKENNGIDIKNLLKKDYYIRKPFITALVFAAVIVFTAVVPSGNVIGKILKPSWKTSEYYDVTDSEKNNYEPKGILNQEYQDSLVMQKMVRMPGRYFIVKADEENKVLSPDISDNENMEISFCEIADADSSLQTVLLFGIDEDEYSVRFNSSQKVMDVSNGEITENNSIQQWDYNGDRGQLYRLKETDNGRYIMTCGEFAIGEDQNGRLILVKEEDIEKTVEVYIKQY